MFVVTGKIIDLLWLADLHLRLRKGYEYRQTIVKKCILVYAEKVKRLSEQRDASNNGIYDSQADRDFKAEQRKLRLLQSELSVEDILKERSTKVFNERCRQYYRVDTL